MRNTVDNQSPHKTKCHYIMEWSRAKIVEFEGPPEPMINL